MTLQPLSWSEPKNTGYASISADDARGNWRITPVPRDITRIHFTGKDADGTIVSSTEYTAYAESLEEAKIVVDILRAGTDHLPGWREQLEASGFVRTFPDRPDTESLSCMWHDERSSGHFSITVMAGFIHQNGQAETSAHATYESTGASFWHNVSNVIGGPNRVFTTGNTKIRDGLPEGVDALKAGVAAALAIRAARQARGGHFATPLGGETKAR